MPYNKFVLKNEDFKQIFSLIRKCFDLVFVGGGIVGCASAREMKLLKPNLKIALVEKESDLGKHQSGHNSGVLHAGIYYQPGSMKAKLCVEGIDLLYRYLDQNKIPYKMCGKLIVAVEQRELSRLNNLFERAQKNGCKGIVMVESLDGIRQIEPNCTGLRAIWSPRTGIVDYSLVTQSFANDFKNCSGHILLNWELGSAKESDDPEYPVLLVPKHQHIDNSIHAKCVVTCAGLHSDKVAEMTGCSDLPRILPVRGEYLVLKNPEKTDLVNGNIYPVPDPKYPFLGVHFTPTMSGDILLGPNAVIAFKREGYKISDFSPSEFCEIALFRGTRNLLQKNIAFCLDEFYRGIFIGKQVKQLQKYVPKLKREDVVRGRTGVRAQALDSEGNLIEDFVFDDGKGEMKSLFLHVRNAPSPGATSSLSIAKIIAKNAIEKFNL